MARRVMVMIRASLTACVAALTLVGATATARDLPSLRSDELASGPYARMHMVLEKTFLQVNVARIDMRFGHATRDRLASLAKGREYSENLAGPIARAAMKAQHAVVQLRFLRDASFERWLEGARENLKQTLDAQLIDEKTYRRVYHHLPRWFRAVRERGFKEDDRLLYRVRPGSLRTVLVSQSDEVLVDRTDQDRESSRILLAGYFAPGTDFREPLIESLFEN